MTITKLPLNCSVDRADNYWCGPEYGAMQCVWSCVLLWAEVAKMLNDAMNNPIVLALALTAVVLAFTIHVFVY